jgi:hypothetical protein
MAQRPCAIGYQGGCLGSDLSRPKARTPAPVCDKGAERIKWRGRSMPGFLDLRVIVVIVSAALMSPSSALARSGGGRTTMESCVDRVLTRLARARAPETQVGPAVISSCDRPLRASLAAAIRSGEADMCTIESCIATARQRAAEEATTAYRQRFRR